MDLAYLKLLAEHKLTVAELPEDAKTAITNINAVLKGVAMLEKRGKSPRADVISKIRLMDKWTCNEIMDFINDTDKNTSSEDSAQIALDAQAAIDKQKEADALAEQTKAEEARLLAEKEAEKKKNTDTASSLDAKGHKIDEELAELFKQGKNSLILAELKQFAPVTYGEVFQSYKDGEENGIETSSI